MKMELLSFLRKQPVSQVILFHLPIAVIAQTRCGGTPVILEWNQGNNSIKRSIIPDGDGITVYSMSQSGKTRFFH